MEFMKPGYRMQIGSRYRMGKTGDFPDTTAN